MADCKNLLSEDVKVNSDPREVTCSYVACLIVCWTLDLVCFDSRLLDVGGGGAVSYQLVSNPDII